MPSICEEKPPVVVSHHREQQQQLSLPPLSTNHTSEATSHLESVMNYLTGNAMELREPPTLGVPSIIISQQHQQQTQQQQQQQQQSVVQQNQHMNNSNSMLSSDTKKLKGAAKRKASFHNLTNPNPANAVNSSLEQQQAVHNQQHQAAVHHSQAPPSGLNEHLARLHEMQQHQQPTLNSSSTSLINPITAMNLLDDRHDIYATGSNDASFLGSSMMRDYLTDVSSFSLYFWQEVKKQKSICRVWVIQWALVVHFHHHWVMAMN